MLLKKATIGTFCVMCIVFFSSCDENLGEQIRSGPPWLTFTTPKLPSNIVTNLYIDRAHRVWVATRGGAAYFKDNSWAIVKDSLRYLTYDNQGNSYPACVVTAICEARDQSIWFALEGGGVVRFNQFSQTGNFWVRYRQPTILLNGVSGITSDLSGSSRLGDIWLTTAVGVNRFLQTSSDGGGDWTSFNSPPLIFYNMVTAATNLVDNTIWFGAFFGGATQVTIGPSLQFTSIPFPAGHDARIEGMAFDANNTVWFAKETEISSLDLSSGVWKHYNFWNTNGIIPVSGVHAVEGDYLNHHWFGTDSGLVSLIDTTWTRYSAGPSTFPNNTVTALRYDAAGNLWIGTLGGVAVYNPSGTKF